jgi:uncharacterized protein (TIGR03435 family)
MPGQVDFPKETWAFAGYASPKAALETFFWALNQQDATNVEASMTPGAREDFTKTMQERVVTVETNVLLLQVKTPNAPGLKASTPASEAGQSSNLGETAEFHSGAAPLIDLDHLCENELGIPVLDRTGLTNNFDVELKWERKNDASRKDSFKKAVLDQLGLELVPGRQPIEMLVVEKVK